MSEIKFRMAAKTDVGLERSNNEDNFQVSANLEESPMRWINNQEYSLGRKGALLVVADGMGGMNAGEVASDIAINTIRELFAPDKITDEVVKTRFTIEKFMKGVVVEADKRIKEYAKDHPDSKGMGTTIVIGWLYDGQLYVTWCGDSRAYIFNPNTGLFQISKDHSYVQQLVDSGKISKEEAFDFPDSNIITRSLSDATPKAIPDCLLKPQPLCNGDIIMLCSDGLNGMIRDNEIEAVIAENQDNMTNCVDALIHSALEAAGADNCTVALCQIVSGGGQSELGRIPKFDSKKRISDTIASTPSSTRKNPVLWISLITLILVILSCIAVFLIKGNPFVNRNTLVEEQVEDSIRHDDEPADVGENSLVGDEELAEENEIGECEKSEEDVGKVIGTKNLKADNSKKSSTKSKGKVDTPNDPKEPEEEKEPNPKGYTLTPIDNSKEEPKEEEDRTP